ncbi:hypothetical protein CROQUDRAFT_110454 [Cronartium quercuum f. sp. fusiforme G11]|uniref:Uncharacterized protein n=1 Tax=Cronartium quercuum f. sp. fusiforme G11 TaxID=708437 RepID=A0A9P6N8Z3_9BASI|nr:hypothetical protein CROQUDRAFT_110454 [Cronartium quercuum f. sp. fusiforme G11]
MCRLINKVVYGLPLPAISLIHAASVLEEQRDAVATLKEIRGRSRLPSELIELVGHHLIAGRAADSKAKSKAQLTTAPHMCQNLCRWCFLLRVDELIEASLSSEDMSIKRLVQCLSRPEFNLDLASQTPIRTTITELNLDEGLNPSEGLSEESMSEPVWVVCLITATSETSSLGSQDIISAQMAETDLSDCPIDQVEGPAAFLEPAPTPPSFANLDIERLGSGLDRFLKTCDLVLDSPPFSFFESRTLLRWWTVMEVECDCLFD